jgi:hypothetical protein
MDGIPKTRTVHGSIRSKNRTELNHNNGSKKPNQTVMVYSQTEPLSTNYTYGLLNLWFTCPVTKQQLSDYTDLTPNHTLRRLIQAWCTLNASRAYAERLCRNGEFIESLTKVMQRFL